MRLRLVASAGLWVSHARSRLACVASVSVRFRSKERGTRVKDRAENGVSRRAGRGWGRKEGNACRQTPGFWKPLTWPVMPEFHSFPSPSPHFHFLALVWFLARPKPRIPFLDLSLLGNQTETLATQASSRLHRCKPLISLVPFNLHLHCFQG